MKHHKSGKKIAVIQIESTIPRELILSTIKTTQIVNTSKTLNSIPFLKAFLKEKSKSTSVSAATSLLRNCSSLIIVLISNKKPTIKLIIENPKEYKTIVIHSIFN